MSTSTPDPDRQIEEPPPPRPFYAPFTPVGECTCVDPFVVCPIHG
jgi:hypothetical protein